jgi:hypothetical protein
VERADKVAPLPLGDTWANRIGMLYDSLLLNLLNDEQPQ